MDVNLSSTVTNHSLFTVYVITQYHPSTFDLWKALILCLFTIINLLVSHLILNP